MKSQRLLTEQEAAALLGLAPATLRKQRCTGPIPGQLPPIPYIRMGRTIRYDRGDLEALIDQLKASAGAPAA